MYRRRQKKKLNVKREMNRRQRICQSNELGPNEHALACLLQGPFRATIIRCWRKYLVKVTGTSEKAVCSNAEGDLKTFFAVKSPAKVPVT
jgi:hypothetical protein